MTMPYSIRAGLREASSNALRVLLGGFIAFGFYVFLILFGPSIEGRFAPVLTDYRLENIRAKQGGGFSFRPAFTKVRDCTYYGVTWFAQSEGGELTRIQMGRTSDPGPPITGPVGARRGERVALYPPADTKAIFALNHHECGTPWQTRTMVGPFMIFNGLPQTLPVDVGYALRRGPS